ncbi:FecR domain-containing protein [Marivirga sp. S37H4]|uniref:FecR domain-containing protein n=1 Tax=Marivirga aurantiaca TaxID=2802615 RepID=A0A934WW27_9BACT|nr:FecR domain-containing protein [Marivirga aurantiaca]MBK6264017.1 FecR domain-containing protein [Marivirga aurantiaca]
MGNKKIKISLDFEIIWKSIHGNLTDNEQYLLDKWLEEDHENRVYYAKAKEHLEHNKIKLVKADVPALRKALAIRKEPSLRKKLGLALFISVAASLILVFSFISFFNETDDKLFHLEEAKQTPIYPEPGKRQAVLHLGGGEKILLGEQSTSKQKIDGKFKKFLNLNKESIEYKKGDFNSDNQPSNQHLLEVQTGGEFMLILSDGTKVWINSESTLKYPANFGTESRVVELSGEAYFEVAHENNRPFQVITGNQTIRVLGTSFNVTSYPNEETTSTLLKGKIQIETDKNDTAILFPGNQAIYHPKKQELFQKQVNVEHFIAWKNGLFYFKDQPLDHIMEVLSRWYSIEVVYKNPEKKNIRFTGTLKRYSSFKEVIKLIEMTGDVKFYLSSNNKVIIE